MSAVRSLDDRTVLVTGGCSGVGRGLSSALASSGANVVVACRDGGSAAVAELQEGGGSAIGVVCDVTRRNDVAAAVGAAVERFGALHAVVHNATSDRSGEPTVLETVSAEVFDDHIGVALDGARWCALEAFPHLVATSGSLLVLTSPAGIEGNATIPLYGAVKAAQRGLVKSLAREWGPHGVTVNCLAPLAMTPAMERAFASTPGLEERVHRRVPLGWLGDPADDIGPAAVFLVSGAARYVTGQTLAVNGGSFTSL
jgi:3-oxoacyl-[acyl-carrier protein] reductase